MGSQISFYNSLSKTVEAFEPKDPGKVRIYNCGPTVYKRQHIGNMRRFLFADFLRRALEFLGYEVREITNITDVGHLTGDDLNVGGEDKLEKEARALKLTPQDIAKKQTDLFFQDRQALNIQPAHKYPKASDHIADMIELIEKLLANKHAYQTKTGVYFDVQSFPAYGKLSGNTLDKLTAGARVEVREEKKHPADFALWKTDLSHLQQWDSPWGRGYPGWHIECSAMSLKYLGPEIDIHTGGEDNRFPHHENEIAQSESALKEKFVRTWMHNAFLKLQGEKLAKREGEQITLDTLREKGFSPLAFRLLVFGSHYRSPLEFSWENLTAAGKQLETMKQVVRRMLDHPLPPRESNQVPLPGSQLDRFAAALSDDLNTPAALAVVMDYTRHVNTQLEAGTAKTDEIWATLIALDKVLGIFEPLRREIELETVPEEIKQLAEARENARRDKQFEKADQLRQEIEGKGWRVEDTSVGMRIVKKPASPPPRSQLR